MTLKYSKGDSANKPSIRVLFFISSLFHSLGVPQCLPFISLSIFIFRVTLLNIYISSLWTKLFFVLFIDLFNSLIYHALLTTNRFYELTDYVTPNNVCIGCLELDINRPACLLNCGMSKSMSTKATVQKQ